MQVYEVQGEVCRRLIDGARDAAGSRRRCRCWPCQSAFCSCSRFHHFVIASAVCLAVDALSSTGRRCPLGWSRTRRRIKPARWRAGDLSSLVDWVGGRRSRTGARSYTTTPGIFAFVVVVVVVDFLSLSPISALVDRMILIGACMHNRAVVTGSGHGQIC